VSSRLNHTGLGTPICTLHDRYGRLSGLDEFNSDCDPPPRRLRIGQPILFDHFVSEAGALWFVNSRESLKKSGSEFKTGKHLRS